MPDSGFLPDRDHIRLTIPSIDETDLEAVREVLKSGQLVQGRHVAEFEAAISAYIGARHTVAVSNGTAALHLALLAMGIEPGDRVAVAAYSWPATANVIVLSGAEPVFVDIDPRTFNLDPEALETCLRRTSVKAIMVVHTFGGMADMPAILAVAARHGVPVIEDAACALGSTLDGRPAGRWGVLGCFSFHPRKSITTGEGGAIVTESDEYATRLRALRNHGLNPLSPVPDFVDAGFNYRLTEMQGALGVTQLRKLDRILEARRRCARRYDEWLTGSPVEPPHALPSSVHSYQSYVALVPGADAAVRDGVIAALRAQHIEATIGTHHMPLIRYFRQRNGFTRGDFPAADLVSARAITLPLHDGLSETAQRRVVSELLAAINATTAA